VGGFFAFQVFKKEKNLLLNLWNCGKPLVFTEPVDKLLKNGVYFFNDLSIGGVSGFPHFHRLF